MGVLLVVAVVVRGVSWRRIRRPEFRNIRYARSSGRCHPFRRPSRRSVRRPRVRRGARCENCRSTTPHLFPCQSTNTTLWKKWTGQGHTRITDIIVPRRRPPFPPDLGRREGLQGRLRGPQSPVHTLCLWLRVCGLRLGSFLSHRACCCGGVVDVIVCCSCVVDCVACVVCVVCVVVTRTTRTQALSV